MQCYEYYKWIPVSYTHLFNCSIQQYVLATGFFKTVLNKNNKMLITNKKVTGSIPGQHHKFKLCFYSSMSSQPMEMNINMWHKHVNNRWLKDSADNTNFPVCCKFKLAAYPASPKLVHWQKGYLFYYYCYYSKQCHLL